MITRLTAETGTANDSGSGTKPHVLFVIDEFSPTLGGGERIVLKLAERLPDYGYRASILVFSADRKSPALNSPPCPVYHLPLRRTYDLTAIKGALHLRRLLKRENVQIVQTFFESSDIWGGLVTKVFSRAKLIWSRRDMGILRSAKHDASYRIMAHLPDAVFAVSDLVRQHCIDVDHIDPDRVLTIYNGLDLARWSEVAQAHRSEERPLITTAGNIRHVKGHDVFIQAAARVVRQFPNASFSIAGGVLEPDYYDQLKAMVRDLRLTGHFHFAGEITNLPEYLSHASIFVLPSRSEGFSNAIVEAMAASLPVIATDVGGNGEAVQDHVTGLMVPSEDVGKLAEAIASLLANPAKAKAMGEAGQRRAAEKFTTNAMMEQTTEVYAKLLSKQ